MADIADAPVKPGESNLSSEGASFHSSQADE